MPDRLLQGRGAKTVIDDQKCIVLMGKFGQLTDVSHFSQRIGRGFQEQKTGFWAYCPRPVIHVRQVDKTGADTKLLQEVGEQHGC